jgi:hypothetical protein
MATKKLIRDAPMKVPVLLTVVPSDVMPPPLVEPDSGAVRGTIHVCCDRAADNPGNDDGATD